MSAAKKLPNEAQRRNEVLVSEFVPYGSHVTENVVKLKSGDYLATFRLQGAAHESADASDINSWHNQLNNFMRNVASPKVALWTHVVRRVYDEYPEGDFEPGFARDLDAKYRAYLASKSSLVNELYVSIIYRPQPVKMAKVFDFMSRKNRADMAEQQADDLAAVKELIDTALAGLDRYEPELLGCYEHKGNMFTELGEFLGFLINGEWRRMPLPRAELAGVLPTSRPLFGKGGLMSLMGPTRSQYGAFLTIQEYPSVTCPGILNELLGMPFEFTLSQSFTFLSKAVALGRMQRQQSRMVNAGDLAKSQVDAIDDAMDDLVSNRFVYGNHHLALMIRDSDRKALDEHVGDAGTAFSDGGMKWAREEIGMAGAFWSQLPGNFEYRVRTADINSRNFAGFSCFHNYPIGRIRGNQWGHAVTAFRTIADSPYFFNWHKGEDGLAAKLAAKADPNHKDNANTAIFGEPGTGKTLLQMFLMAESMKFNNRGKPGGNVLSGVIFDKDLGAAVATLAMGGRYYALKNGQKTGWNPFQMEPTPGNLIFLEKLVRRLVRRENQPFTRAQEKMIERAVAGVMSDQVPREFRRLRAVQEFMQDVNDENGLYARLSRWAGPGAPLGWLFDNPEDTLNLEGTPLLGFDVTEFLPNEETREPTIMYLLHRIDTLLDGRRVPICMDEVGQLVKDQTFAELIGNKLVTIRKQDGFLILGTQFPAQLLKSSVAEAVVSATATKIFLPNPSANRDDYVNGMKLTEREFEIVKNLGPKSRQFLVKQGGNSVVCQFNLKGFNDEIAVLSGNTATSKLALQLVEELGNDPSVWLPVFHERRKAALA